MTTKQKYNKTNKITEKQKHRDWIGPMKHQALRNDIKLKQQFKGRSLS